MRMTFSRSNTKILPSPILPVLADFSIASIARSSNSDLIAASTFTLGRKSTTYSAPRYSSVWPFCRPKPFTSVTVIPCTPIADSASRTSSSLNGLMIAVTSFTRVSLEKAPDLATRRPSCLDLERLADGQDYCAGTGILVPLGAARVVPVVLGVGVDVRGAENPAAHVVRDAELPVVVVEVVVRLDVQHPVVADD